MLRRTDPDSRVFVSVRAQVSGLSLPPVLPFPLLKYGNRWNDLSTRNQTYSPQNEINLYSPLSCISIRLMLVTSFAYSPTLKMKAMRSSETSVNFYRTARGHIPDVSIHCNVTKPGGLQIRSSGFPG
jgi:hypothetical protein